jgi:hypothetical protein
MSSPSKQKAQAVLQDRKDIKDFKLLHSTMLWIPEKNEDCFAAMFTEFCVEAK